MIASYEETKELNDHCFIAKDLNCPKFPFYWHYNNCFELTVILRGSGNRYIGSDISEFSAGELVLIGPNLPHTWDSCENQTNSRAIVFHFTENSCGEGLFDKNEMQDIKKMLNRSKNGLLFTPTATQTVIENISALPVLDGWQRITTLLEILGKLSKANCRTISENSNFGSLDQKSQDRFSRVCSFINTNFTDPQLSQADIAAQIHMSSSRFSQFFKQICGKSYIEYLNSTRLNHACKMLIETDKSITEICFESGFSNIANFNRHFKKQKVKTPRQYRYAFTKQ